MRLAAPALALVAAVSLAVPAGAQIIGQAGQDALENARSGTVVQWRNPDDGATGSFVPKPAFQDAGGQICREFQQTVTIGSQQQQAWGMACRQGRRFVEAAARRDVRQSAARPALRAGPGTGRRLCAAAAGHLRLPAGLLSARLLLPAALLFVVDLYRDRRWRAAPPSPALVGVSLPPAPRRSRHPACARRTRSPRGSTRRAVPGGCGRRACRRAFRPSDSRAGRARRPGA